MTSKAQQIELDNVLVAPENHRVIGKYNMRINPGMKPKEPTYQFWATVSKHSSSYRFKIDNKRFSVNVEVFREILNICPKVSGKAFDEPPTEEEALSFIRELGHTGEIKYITDVIIDHLHQPWGTFASIINKCLCGKIDNKDSKTQDKMFYHRFTKIIIHHFLTKDKSISMRNRMFMHTARDDSLLGTMRFVSRHADTQVYGAILPQAMTNQALLDFVAYKTYYAIASGAEPPKLRKSQKKYESTISSKEYPSKKKHAKAKKDVATKPKPTKKKAPVKAGTTARVVRLLYQKGYDEQHQRTTGTDKGTGAKLGVPDVPKYESNSEQKSWGDSDKEDNDDEDNSSDESDDGDNDDDDDGNEDVGDNNDGKDDDEASSKRTELTKSDHHISISSNEVHDKKKKMLCGNLIDITKELYKDVNANLGNEDTEMIHDDQGGADEHNVSQESGFVKEGEDAHVTLTTVYDSQKTEGPMQRSSVSSDFTSKLLNLENISLVDNEIASLMDSTVHHAEPSSQTSSLAYRVPIIDLVDTSVRSILREEVKTQLPQILPKAVSDFATPVIETNVTESLEAAVLAKSSSQPKSTYEAAASLLEFELTKILIDKMEKNKSYDKVDYKRELYDALVQSYNTDKDLFDTYGEVFSLKRSCDEKEKDQDPFVGSNRRTKRRKSSKDAESSRDSRSKEKKSSSTPKDAFHSQHKSSGKSAHAEEPSHTVDDSGVHQNQEFDMGHTDDQPDIEAAPKLDFQPPQTWISQVARAEDPPTSFDELYNTPIDFSAFVLNQLNITDMTQEILVGSAFNLLKGTCMSQTELEYHFEECSKATTERLDWHNLEGKPYPFDLCKPFPLIPDHRGRQVIPRLKIMKKCDYGPLDEIEVRREDQKLYTFKEGDFPRLRLQDIEDMLLLLVQQKLTNLTIDERYDLNVALRMFTRRIVIQKGVEDLQLGVESYQKKLNLTKPDTFRPDLRKSTTYSA
ncbi:hypothetical protein Tco_0862724 [Tanacetum coccineum]